MKAIVKVINPARGMYAAEIDGGGEFVIFELLDTSEPELDDVITHPDFYSMGGETYRAAIIRGRYPYLANQMTLVKHKRVGGRSLYYGNVK